jgi:CheY-like chemotaxis protein
MMSDVVLIVEDETQVLIFAESVLQQAGYETLSASSVAEALAIRLTLPAIMRCRRIAAVPVMPWVAQRREVASLTPSRREPAASTTNW